ncbi:MAG: hypothetical protein H6617_07720 [Bdellovibrionaceae bacterium]|nr:hypothetical protein [Bdellovibrionales bacterium]MCB9254554.1 hypothetical protein [Pseudobdellovibrionaceae bacterium]
MKKKSLLLLGLAISIGLVFALLHKSTDPEVTDFASCVAAGNPVLPTVPGQCNHGGKVFMQSMPQ